ncbi:hypothetical protein BJX65DRAFT_285754 [Aspergillus insuetus]
MRRSSPPQECSEIWGGHCGGLACLWASGELMARTCQENGLYKALPASQCSGVLGFHLIFCLDTPA